MPDLAELDKALNRYVMNLQIITIIMLNIYSKVQRTSTNNTVFPRTVQEVIRKEMDGVA